MRKDGEGIAGAGSALGANVFWEAGYASFPPHTKIFLQESNSSLTDPYCFAILW